MKKPQDTCCFVLNSMGFGWKDLKHYAVYTDTGVPMVFFTIKSIEEIEGKKEKLRQYVKKSLEKKKGKQSIEENSGLSPQQKAWVTIRKNKNIAGRNKTLVELQSEYDKATSAGIKAGIKRKMNKLRLVSAQQ